MYSIIHFIHFCLGFCTDICGWFNDFLFTHWSHISMHIVLVHLRMTSLTLHRNSWQYVTEHTFHPLLKLLVKRIAYAAFGLEYPWSPLSSFPPFSSLKYYFNVVVIEHFNTHDHSWLVFLYFVLCPSEMLWPPGQVYPRVSNFLYSGFNRSTLCLYLQTNWHCYSCI